MASLAKQMVMCHAAPKSTNHHQSARKEQMPSTSPQSHSQNMPTRRRLSIISTLLASSAAALGGLQSAAALAASGGQTLSQTWGGRSLIWERYFEPELSPEAAVARIKQTAEGMRSLREMLDTMCWKYVMVYIRLKQVYLESDLKNAMATLPPARRSTYVKTANELVENMVELDIHVRSPKIYESYLYYEKTLKSLDDLVALLA
ncbi:Photosynthetic NDH subunit of lumenal location 2, chloroplastic [Asimina triloba]